MSGSPAKFPNSSEPYIPSSTSTIPGSILPKNTHIFGKPVLIFTLNNSEPDQLRLRVSSRYAQTTLINDYVAPSPSRKVKWLYHIVIKPSEHAKNAWTNIKQEMEEEHKRLSSVLGHEIKISADGMKVVGVKGLEVEIEATGARMIWTESKGAWTIFQASTQSTAPSWLESPDDLFSPSPTKASVPVKAPVRSGNLRPITSHIPLKVGLRPMEMAFVAAAQKRKRSESPSKSLAEASTSVGQAEKRLMVEPGLSSRSSGFPSRFPIAVGRELPATQPPAPSAPQAPAGLAGVGSRDVSGATLPKAGTTGPASVVYRLNPVAEDAQPSPQALANRQTGSATAADDAPIASPPRMSSSSTAPGNTRAEAEAKARSAATRRHALQVVAEEQERAKASELRAGLALAEVKYTTLRDCREGHLGNIMGIVLETTQPKATRKDHFLSIVVTDPATYTGDSSGEDMVITIFRPDVSSLPVNLPRGTPIMFRHLKFSSYNMKIKGQAFSGDRNCWVYLLGGIQVKFSDIAIMQPRLCTAEIDRMKALKKWWDDGGNVDAGAVTAGAGESTGMARTVSSGSARVGHPKINCLGDIGYNVFTDVIFKIVHIGSGSRVFCELYVVDGTLSRLPLRNFHNVEHLHVPITGIYKIDIMHAPAPADQAIFVAGNVVMLRNVRSKEYKGALEMIWAEKVTEEQKTDGWKSKRPQLILPGDERALIIERRINEYKTGGQSGSASTQVSPSKPNIDVKVERRTQSPTKPETVSVEPPSAPIADPTPAVVKPSSTDIRLATHVCTTFTDPIDHPTQTISEVIANGTFPNKFRVKARVRSVRPRGLKGNDTYVQKHCGHCRRAIVKKQYCESCNDVKMINASWRYHFIAVLEDEDTSIPILISDEEAARFLPRLPPCSPSDNPNDIRKTYRQIAETKKGVLDVLQGAPLDGIRPLPYIDWTVMSCIVAAPKGYGGVGGCKGVAVYKAFGMEGR